MLDKTLKDLNRRPLTFGRSTIESALPEHFVTEYPQLIKLFEAYYKFLDSDEGDFGNILQNLSTTRDIGQTAASNLTYIEDELLLGQNYIEGLLDKRTGAELSNNFYKTKGSKFSIERFFRAFFNVDPDIIYGKNLLFTVGETPIGTGSGKYIQNDKLYQYWGMLIKTSIPQSKWLDLYKLFVHPGGMYIASQVEISNVVVNTPSFDILGFVYVNDQDIRPVTYETENAIILASFGETLSIVTMSDRDGGGETYRLRQRTSHFDDWYIPGSTPTDSDYGTIAYVANRYSTMIGMADVTTFTIDQDSDIGLLVSDSNTRETIDQDTYNYYDSA